MNVQLLLVPYDSGRRGWRMGAGPEHLLRAGLEAHLRSQGHEVGTDVLTDDPHEPPAEVRSAFELMRRLAPKVRAAREAGAFPLVMSGNCNSACGTLAGLTPSRRAVFWFDAHADLNTPSTTTSGFVDGMALATAQGLCWEQLAATIPGFERVKPELVFLLGVRDLDPPEAALVASSGIARLPPNRLAEQLPALLGCSPLPGSVAYLHCDLDVLDPGIGRANLFPVPGGLSVEALTSAIGTIGAAVRVEAAALTAYAPEYDTDGAVCRAAFAVADAILAAARHLPRP
jgi:arginase